MSLVLQRVGLSAIQVACMAVVGAVMLPAQSALAQGNKAEPMTPDAPATKQVPATPTDVDPRRARGQVVETPAEPGVQRIGTGRSTGGERSLSIRPGFSVNLTATDNIDLDPAGSNRNAGQIFQITPFVDVKIRQPGSKLDLSAAVGAQKYVDSDVRDQRVDGSLSASGDVSVVGDALRLNGDANIFRINSTGLGGTGVTGGARTQDTEILRTVRLAPYSLGRIGLNTDYLFGYEYEMIDRGVRRDGNRLFGEAEHKGLGDGKLGVLTRVDARDVKYENDFGYQNVSALVGASWALTGRLKLGAGIYYAGIDELEVDGDNSSIGPAVYWDWRATERTGFQGQVADTYYGTNISMRFRQLFQRWVFSANYNKGVEDGNSASTFLFRPIDAFRGSTRRSNNETLNSFNASLSERDLDLGPGSRLFAPTLDAGVLYDDTVSVSAAYVRPRHAAVAALYLSDRSAATEMFTATADDEITQWGGYGAFDFLLSSRNSIRLIGQYIRADMEDSGQSTLFNGVDLSYRRQLTSRSNLRVGVRFSIQDGDGGAKSFKETAGSITYTYRLN